MVEDEPVLSVVVANGVIDFWDFAGIVLVSLAVIEILLQLGPAAIHQHYIFALA